MDDEIRYNSSTPLTITGEVPESIVKYGGYKGFKAQMDYVMKRSANDFITIGEMLKEARDTDILKESGYSGMGEFAKAEYGLRPDQTSRFISIAEKFGNGKGRLRPEYTSHGLTKLSEMLSLPGSVAEVIPPELSKEDIRTIKAEVAAEDKITPLEVAMEGQQDADELTAFLRTYLTASPAEAKRAKKAVMDATPEEKPPEIVMNALAPSGIGVLESRPAGMGRIMLTFNGVETMPKLTVIRQDTTQDCTWAMLWHRLKGILENMDIPEDVKEAEDDKKVKIAPAQPEAEEPEKAESVEPEKAPGGQGSAGDTAAGGEDSGKPGQDVQAEPTARVKQPVETEELPPVNPPVKAEDPYKPLRGTQEGRDCIVAIRAQAHTLETILKDANRLKPDEERYMVQDMAEKFELAARDMQKALEDFLAVRLKEEAEG